MARETMGKLLRLRRLEVRELTSALATAMRTEEQACRARDIAAATITQETADAQVLAQRDAALAGFVRWRVRAMQALRDAEARAADATEAVRAARAALGAARGAMRAVELALERREAETEFARQRSAQHALEDAARSVRATGQ